MPVIVADDHDTVAQCRRDLEIPFATCGVYSGLANTAVRNMSIACVSEFNTCSSRMINICREGRFSTTSSSGSMYGRSDTILSRHFCRDGISETDQAKSAGGCYWLIALHVSYLLSSHYTSAEGYAKNIMLDP